MKLKYIFLFFFTLIFLFTISKYTFSNDFYYLSLGDSLAEGVMYDGTISDSYSDFIYNYYNDQNKMSFYTKSFAKSGYTSIDLLKDIQSDKHITINDKNISLINAINEANLITLSIGANNFFRKIEDNVSKFDIGMLNKLEKYIDDVLFDIEVLFTELRKYNNKEIIVIGYYNPITFLTDYETKTIEPYFATINQKLSKLCEKYDITFIDIYEGFSKNKETFLPNPIDIHPSKEGYKYIANRIINEIDDNILKK